MRRELQKPLLDAGLHTAGYPAICTDESESQWVPSGVSCYLQRGYYPSFTCPICSCTAYPTSKSDRTCGEFACSEKWRRTTQAERDRKNREKRKLLKTKKLL
jgi:hypothetical protein